MQSIVIADPQALGQAIRKVRQGLGITQPTLALGAGVGVRFVVDVERGKSTAQIGKLMRVLATLGITIALQVPNDNATQAGKHGRP